MEVSIRSSPFGRKPAVLTGLTFYMWIVLADHYLLFDFPGQVELFTLHSNAKNVILEMANKWDYRVRLPSRTL